MIMICSAQCCWALRRCVVAPSSPRDPSRWLFRSPSVSRHCLNEAARPPAVRGFEAARPRGCEVASLSGCEAAKLQGYQQAREAARLPVREGGREAASTRGRLRGCQCTREAVRPQGCKAAVREGRRGRKAARPRGCEAASPRGFEVTTPSLYTRMVYNLALCISRRHGKAAGRGHVRGCGGARSVAMGAVSRGSGSCRGRGRRRVAPRGPPRQA